MTVDKIKKRKAQESVSSNKTLNLKINKNCLEASQLEKKSNNLEINEIILDNYHRNYHQIVLKKP